LDIQADLSSSPSTSKFQTNSSETANSSESFEQVNHSAIEQPNEVTNSTDQNYNSTHYSQDSSGNESESKQVNENGYPNEPSSQYSLISYFLFLFFSFSLSLSLSLSFFLSFFISLNQ
jgi:hypothetical protein